MPGIYIMHVKGIINGVKNKDIKLVIFPWMFQILLNVPKI